MSPADLADASKCYACADTRLMFAEIVYLLNLANGGGTPQQLAANSNCFVCDPNSLASMVYLLSIPAS